MRSTIVVFSISLLLFFLGPLRSENVTGTYAIEVAGARIGNLYTAKVSKGDLTYYYFNSKVSIWLFIHIIVSHQMICVYNKNDLQSVDIKSFANGENYSSKIKWQSDHYDVNVNTYKYKNNKPITMPVHFGVVKLFFEEPIAQTNILAENYGVLAPITMLKQNVYQVEVIDKKNKYTYENGELLKAEMEGVIKNFIIRKLK
jgi:hypothetical protein